ncbi:hypothetical protein NQ315_015432 [Exocentrus adspersus]|uniref:Uncharacterized protein n=1 Tax=Exocentrus adspersus TaxID=1586481 RepID=A0AAV8VMG4_9CUCU|nr:hypothetical protein NQ315_015432 [Exocentrus adspersus]
MDPLLVKCLFLIFIPVVMSVRVITERDVEMNNKCTYSFNKRILNCVQLETVDRSLGEFITSRTQMLFLRDSKKVVFDINHHTSPNYSNLVGYQVLNSCSFFVSPGGFFGLSNVQYMEMHGNIWREIDDDIFVGLRSLEVLNLGNNQIKQLNTKSFNGLNKLKNLDLSDNAIEVIPSYVFQTLNELESLYVNNNLLKVVQENAFLGLASLDMLFLTNNSLEYIDSNEFNKLKNLEHLNANFNKIKSIIGQLRLAKLQFLQLTNNELNELECNVLVGCLELLSVDLSKNKLGLLTEKPFLNLVKLRYLNLYGNNVNFGAFSNLKEQATIIHN